MTDIQAPTSRIERGTSRIVGRVSTDRYRDNFGLKWRAGYRTDRASDREHRAVVVRISGDVIASRRQTEFDPRVSILGLDPQADAIAFAQSAHDRQAESEAGAAFAASKRSVQGGE